MSEVMLQADTTSELSNGEMLSMSPRPKAEAVAMLDLEFRYGFKLGGYGLLIPESVQSEVVTTPEIFPIPNTADLMIGLISVRGQFSPVFDLGKILELAPRNRQSSIIVLNIKGDLLGFPFDSAHSLELPPSVSENTPKLPTTLSQFAGNIYQTDQEFWIEFDFKRCMEQFSSKISQ